MKVINNYYGCGDCSSKHKRLMLIKRVQIHEIQKQKEGVKHMTEVQQDQWAEMSYSFVDDGVPTPSPVDVFSIEVVSSNPEFLTVEALPKTEVGIYPYRLSWAGLGVGTIDLTAEKRAGDPSPIVDQEAFSTIPNLAEGVSKTIVINEL